MNRVMPTTSSATGSHIPSSRNVIGKDIIDDCTGASGITPRYKLIEDLLKNRFTILTSCVKRNFSSFEFVSYSAFGLLLFAVSCKNITENQSLLTDFTAGYALFQFSVEISIETINPLLTIFHNRIFCDCDK